MTKSWESADKRYIWHPFTQMKDWQRQKQVVIRSGDGNYLVDTDGRRYLDGVSSLWCNVHGHRVPEIDRAIRKQLRQIAHSTFLGLSHVPGIELSERLIQIAPKGLSRVFYSDSGSAAVEVALKMAYQYWRHRGYPRKKTFINLTNSYHGDTLGSVSVGGIELFHRIFQPLIFKTYPVDAPYAYRDVYRGSEAGYAKYCADKAETVLKKYNAQVCAMVVEPLMQGAAGMLNHPRGYLKRLSDLCRKYNVLLIADEVATGFGRTGRMFACEHENVTPDLLCVAKGITGGYLPLSATLVKEKIYRNFLGEHSEFKAFFHGHTYSANPLACAAAIANLDLFKKRKTLNRLQPKIRIFTQELKRFELLGHVGDVRQTGFMVGIELVKNRQTKAPYPPGEMRGMRVCALARQRGVMIRPLGNVIVLMPPLSVTSFELRRLCRVVYESVEKGTGRGV